MNLPKAVLVSCLAGALVGLLAWNIKTIPKTALFIVLLFWVSFLPPMLFSGAPSEQQLFGVYGRNTGLITYFSLSIIFLGAVTFSTKALAQKFVIGLVVAGSINIVISIFQINDVELLRYNNTYKNALGTFGNPNFVSAFIAMSSAVAANYLLEKTVDIKIRFFSFLYLSLSLFVVIQSDALQGVFVLLGVILLSILVRLNYTQKKILKLSVYAGSLMAAALSITGFLGIGPLAGVLSQTTVKLRGEYWQAGINMFEKNLWSGVGLNSYGDWYRESREASALILPGVNTVTNSAHNVFIDFAATGVAGHILAYLIFVSYVIVSIVKQLRIDRSPNLVFSSLAIAWIGYIVQSVVSIDQIGLSIWGWALGGILIAYPNFQDIQTAPFRKISNRNQRKNTDSLLIPIVVSTFLFVAGGSVYTETIQSDLSWRKNFSTKSVETLIQVSTGRPLVDGRVLSAAEILRTNGFNQEALELAQLIVEYKPRSYYAWLEIYKNNSASSYLVKTAKEKLRGLDPLNNEFQ